MTVKDFFDFARYLASLADKDKINQAIDFAERVWNFFVKPQTLSSEAHAAAVDAFEVEAKGLNINWAQVLQFVQLLLAIAKQANAAG